MPEKIREALSYVPPDDRACKTCGIVKPLTEFHPVRYNGKTYWRRHCRKCVAARRVIERKKRRAKDPARFQQQNRKWSQDTYRRHAAKFRARHAAWKKRNREQQTLYENNRRARMLAAEGELSPDIRARLLELQKGKCAFCKTLLAKTGHDLDHIEPLSRGGANADHNVQLLCPACNRRKYNKDPIEFAQQNGRLL